MEVANINNIEDYARRVQQGAFGARGMSGFRVESLDERNTLLDAVTHQRFARQDSQTAVSFGIEQKGGEFNVTLPMNAPPYEQRRIESVANQTISKMKTIERLRKKRAEKHKTDSTS